MKQIVFISGKGGTGKTTVVATISQLAGIRLIADCDVDAPNLDLLMQAKTETTRDYSGSQIAIIDGEACVTCDMCRQFCRFDAISADPVYHVDPLSCEGCGVCRLVCPAGAVTLRTQVTGQVMLSQTEHGSFAHARLLPGADGSGKLVTELRKLIFDQMTDESYVLIDGSPGIGCPVIASITGTDAVVILTEPTVSGRHDMQRILEVAGHFRVPAFVCINKSDLNAELCQAIHADCQTAGVEVLAEIPFDPAVVSALQQGLSPYGADLRSFIDPVTDLWQKLTRQLRKGTFV